jgi:hypothetical protein
MKVTFASGLYDRMQALYTKQVEPQGIEFYSSSAKIGGTSSIARCGQEFDLAEMS